MVGRTSIGAANHSDSLRTTIPIHIAKILDLKVGDQIEWSVSPRDNEFEVKIKFIKNPE